MIRNSQIEGIYILKKNFFILYMLIINIIDINYNIIIYISIYS